MNLAIKAPATTKTTAPSIASSSMLVELNIGVWSGRKLDKSVSQEIDVAKQTSTRAGNYNKKLFADEPEFEALAKFAANTRTFHYHKTMPWNDGGQRLLTTKLYFDYHKYMTAEQTKFFNLVDRCMDDWDNMVARAAVKLGALFNLDEYPDREAVRNRFHFRIKYAPVPEVGDFRCDINTEALAELQEAYEKAYTEQLTNAYSDVWQRTHEALKHMSNKLAGENKQLFRDSLVGNVQEMVDLLDGFNITDDPKMREAKRKIEQALKGVTPDGLREDSGFRLETKQKVDELLKEMAW